IESHELFDKLISKETITGEDGEEESPLKHLEKIKQIRDEESRLFERIKRLPVKARTARISDDKSNGLLTFFRKGKIEKFYLSNKDETRELDFITAANMMEVEAGTERTRRKEDFYDLLKQNKETFKEATKEEDIKPKRKGGRDSATQLLKKIKAIRKTKIFTDIQEDYLNRIMQQLVEGGFPKQTSKTANNELKEAMERIVDPKKLYAVVRQNIPDELLDNHRIEVTNNAKKPREVILSEYLTNE